MKRWFSCLAAMAVIAACGVVSAAGQQGQANGLVIVPSTNSNRPEDVGKRAHTNFLIFVRTKNGKPSPQASAPGGEIPQSLSCVYGTWAGSVSGCPITTNGYGLPTGGSNVIAIVDAYDYPTACNDFNVFSSEFGLPTANCGNNGNDAVFDVVYANGSKPSGNCSWNQEAALDIEWAHAMAPNAKIILVEAASNSNNNLLQAISVANNLVSNGGGGEVSMSWGGSEFSGESSYDGSYFSTKGVTYFASSGDTGGTQIWPSVSANVISAGGTHVSRDANGNFTGESVWSGAGGGPSKYVTAPLYQDVVSFVWTSGKRGTPDISFDADPYTGVSVYDSTSCQGYVNWMVFGGTSVASPSLAGIANAAGALSGGWDGGSNSNSTSGNLYSNYNSVSGGGKTSPYPNTFYDVTSGSAGSYSAGPDWDYASGIGSVRGLTGFASGAPPSPDFSISATPSSRTVTAGSGTTYTVSVTALNGYSGTVTLSASGLPTDATTGFSPGTVTGSGSSTLTVTAGATTGTFTLTIAGTDSAHSLTHSTTVSLTINPASSGDFSLGAASPTITVSRGSSGSDLITITPSGGFNSSVSFSVSGLPRFTSASFSPNPATGSTTLTVSANKHTSLNSTPITVTGTSGSLVHSIPLTLTIK